MSRRNCQFCALTAIASRPADATSAMNSTGCTWSLVTAGGQAAQRSLTTPGQQAILTALKLPEPPRFFDFTIETGATG
jgi:hypothetical protein